MRRTKDQREVGGGASDIDARPGRYMITLFCRKSAYYFATSFP